MSTGVQLVGNPSDYQVSFEISRILIRSREYRHLLVPDTHLFVPIFDALTYLMTLIIEVIVRNEAYFFTVLSLRPQLLAPTVEIVPNEVVGGLHYLFSGPVVLFESDDFSARAEFFEVQYEISSCTPEPIDHLIVVTDTCTLLGFVFNEQLKPLLLQFVQILYLIHQDILKLFLINSKDSWLRIEKFDGQLDQISIVHRILLKQMLLIRLINHAKDGLSKL